ncbi:HNH endonuclease [Gymnodinialimonas ceratoperidinii]|uniref:HNH endonuclease n=1 Tax=Gymnodinialimonas ceratoperidinii TaxID=2856823 RepID=A0A8F6TVF3_9RHOB|nr:HNH endonuclease [Gymnodinialimonas ceratoperidinii]QXT39420.1 HNH endonuclease [Gymnodinialimonas ceratoperidinii]
MFAKVDEHGKIPEDEPVKIDRFEPILQRKFLVELGKEWYSVETPIPPANSYEPLIVQTFEEGEQSMLLSKRVERSAAARKRCLDIHGHQCLVCNKSMSDRYGEMGEDVIDVHHLNELSQTNGKYLVDPETDLVPVCPNCHRMIHTQQPALSLEAVRKILTKLC